MHLYDWLLLIALSSCPGPLMFCLMREVLKPAGGGPAGPGSSPPDPDSFPAARRGLLREPVICPQ